MFPSYFWFPSYRSNLIITRQWWRLRAERPNQSYHRFQATFGNYKRRKAYTENQKSRRIKKIEFNHVSFITFGHNYKIQSSEIEDKNGIFDLKVISLNGSLLMLPGFNVRLHFLCICTSINKKLTAIGKNFAMIN